MNLKTKANSNTARFIQSLLLDWADRNAGDGDAVTIINHIVVAVEDAHDYFSHKENDHAETA